MFVGRHGSWNRKPRSGYDVIFVPFADGKPSGAPLPVLDGFLSNGGEARGRPVGVAIDRRGALLVADDVGNAVWRVTSAPAERTAAAGVAGHETVIVTEPPPRFAPLVTTTVNYRWEVPTPHLSAEPRDVGARVLAPSFVSRRIDYDAVEWTSERRLVGRVADFECKYSDLGLPNRCVTTWRDVYVDVPVPVVRRNHVDVDVLQWSQRDWRTVVDVPQLTWTRETLVVTLPALAVPRHDSGSASDSTTSVTVSGARP
jgi:hypothetical protein